MSIKLYGRIEWTSGMWYSEITADGDEFVLTEQSEMMLDTHIERFNTLEAAFSAMLSHS